MGKVVKFNPRKDAREETAARLRKFLDEIEDHYTPEEIVEMMENDMKAKEATE